MTIRRHRFATKPEPEVYTADRPGILERLGRLAGASSYRTPVEGASTNRPAMTPENELAMALGMARTGDPSDIGPDMAFDMATQSGRHQQRVCSVLAGTLDAMHREHRVIGRNRPYLRVVAWAGYTRLVYGTTPAKPDSMGAVDWEELTDVAERVLAEKADEAVWRAGRALRKR